jgi:hypothetical protein
MTNICGAGRKHFQKMPLQAIKSIATKQALIECAGLIIALNRGDLWTPVHHRALQHNWRIVTEWVIADRACLVVATNYGIYQQTVRQCKPGLVLVEEAQYLHLPRPEHRPRLLRAREEAPHRRHRPAQGREDGSQDRVLRGEHSGARPARRTY